MSGHVFPGLNVRPCCVAVGGWELPEEICAGPEMQRLIALVSNTTTMINALYSQGKEPICGQFRHNLPLAIAAQEPCPLGEACRKAAGIHNDALDPFHAGAPRPTDAAAVRFTKGLLAWAEGNHAWHRALVGTRYSIPTEARR